MLSYEAIIEELNTRLPMFSRLGSEAIKKGLDNIIALCEALGNPQNNFPSIHIAGTNGKGSTSHLIAAAFQHNGYRTGLYTSPHLVDLRERFRINGIPVSKDFIIRFMERAEPLLDTIRPSYFELNVAMAFTAFAAEQVDIAIIETGLGGRLDSTNIIRPLLSVITNISLEHTQLLGNTLEEIAGEKAGIIKENVPVIIGETQPETERVFIQTAFARHATVFFADKLWDLVPGKRDTHYQEYRAIPSAAPDIIPFRTDLLGVFQASNIKTALAATQVLNQKGWKLPLDRVLQSFGSVRSATGLRGRWDWLRREPNIILDVAHNVAGITLLMENIQTYGLEQEGTLHILCGFVKDKDIPAVLALFPKKAVYYFTQAKIPRAFPASELRHIAGDFGLTGNTYPDTEEAIAAALKKLGKEDTLLVTGSFFIAGEALAFLEK